MPGGLSGQVGQHWLYSGGAWGRLWPLTSPSPLPCSQGATQQDLGPWCPCYGSGPGPTSSPTVYLLLLWAAPPRPWTCSWRAAPLSSLWLPRPSGAAPSRDGAGGEWGCGEGFPGLRFLPPPVVPRVPLASPTFPPRSVLPALALLPRPHPVFIGSSCKLGHRSWATCPEGAL